MNNRRTLELIHGAAEDAEYNSKYYQAHKDWKHDYNVKYYKENKDYWREYYKKQQAILSAKTGQSYSGPLVENARYGKPQQKLGKTYADSARVVAAADSLRRSGNDALAKKIVAEAANGRTTLLDKLERSGKARAVKQVGIPEHDAGQRQSDYTMELLRMANNATSSASKNLKKAALRNEIKTSAENAVSTWVSGAKSIASAASKYGTNWKSGAKDIISKGKALTSKIGSLFSKPVKQAVLDYKGGTEKILTEKILTEKIIRE